MREDSVPEKIHSISIPEVTAFFSALSDQKPDTG